jgi:hypothetical protein
MRAVAKKFPKNLFGLPWKVDFHIRVPELTDIEIDAGIGPLKISGVEGAMRVNALQSDAQFSLTGGYFSGIIQRGAVSVTVPARSWHGLGMTLHWQAARSMCCWHPDLVETSTLRFYGWEK